MKDLVTLENSMYNMVLSMYVTALWKYVSQSKKLNGDPICALCLKWLTNALQVNFLG